MYFDSILIEPGHGYFDVKTYSQGKSKGHLVEVDVIDSYVAGVCEELDLEGIRWEILPTRKAPGLSDIERAARCQPGKLVLSCHTGWTDGLVGASNTYYGNEASKELAEKLSKSMEKWGKEITWVHARGDVEKKDLPILVTPQVAVLVEPFPLNLEASLLYASRLEALGRSLGKSVAAYAKQVTPSLGPRPWRGRVKELAKV